MTLVRLEDVDDESLYGGKATELGNALRANHPVPDGLGVSYEFLDELVDTQKKESELVDKVRELEGPYVVRSSGIGEDSEKASFAGQHLTVINVVDPEGVVEALKRVHASSRSEGVMKYREEMGIEEPPKMGAVIQNLVDADKSGVLFTRNPVDGSDERVIEASWGLGEAVVESMVTPDSFRLSPGGEVLEKRAGEKDIRVIPSPDGGTRRVSVPDPKQNQLCLNEQELQALNRLAKRCEEYRSVGHDIEWAFAGDKLYLLQRRDITTEY